MTYIGDGNNVAHSLMFAGAKTGMHVVIACPAGYEPDPQVVEMAKEDAKATNAIIEVMSDISAATKDADVLYSDVWTSMGQEAEAAERLSVLAPYQVNAELLKLAKPDAIWMHCLPAHRGEEVTEDIMEGPQSVIFDQAENRMHAQKAVLASVI